MTQHTAHGSRERQHFAGGFLRWDQADDDPVADHVTVTEGPADDPGQQARLDALLSASERAEAQWVEWIRQARPLTLPLQEDTVQHGSTVRMQHWGPVFGPEGPLERSPDALHPFVILQLFLVRLTGDERLTLVLELPAVEPSWQHRFLRRAPVQISLGLHLGLREALAQAGALLAQVSSLVPPGADLLQRYPGLPPGLPSPLLVALDGQGMRWRLQPGLPSEQFAALYQAFGERLAQWRAGPDAPEQRCLADLPLLTDAARAKVLSWSAAQARPFDLTQSYISCLAARLPAAMHHTAVEAPAGTSHDGPAQGEALSYAELLLQAAAVAERLAELELPANCRILVAAERRVALIPVLLGIFAAGHAYLPLELQRYPPERMRQMIQDAEPALAIALSDAGATELKRASALRVLDGRTLLKAHNGDSRDLGARRALDRFLDQQQAEAIAYLIFTSGSTGTPKAVEVTQRSLLNHNLAVIELFGLGPRDRVLQFGALGFDLSLEEIFPTLLAGGTLVLMPDRVKESAADFFGLLRRQRVTVLDLPTAFWHGMVGMLASEPVPADLRLVVIGGEQASVEHAERFRRLAPRVRLLNTYGPTETTIIATATEDLANIGHPIANARAYVLDACHQLCPSGVIGELAIGGQPVARGYRGRAGLTEERFQDDPFAPEIERLERAAGNTPLTQAAARRLYRTGDRACFTPAGELIFFGRDDGQVKIHGFRVETDAIKQAVLRHPGVRDAAVIAVARKTAGTEPSLDLACYLVSEAAETELDLNAIRGALTQQLPSYMVPRFLLQVSAIPLNANGKVDASALPPPAMVQSPDRGCLNPEIDSTLELQIASALRSALGIEHYRPDASFDALGGDSMGAIQFLLELERLSGYQVSADLLFRAPSLSALARELEAAVDRAWSPLVTLGLGDSSKPPLFLIHTTPGDLLGYINLVRRLDDRRLYGIQSRGLDLSSPPATSIEEMAADYVSLLTSQWPDGPVYLSGWCFGGIVATEMVAQLERAGQPVELFVPIETWGQPLPTLRTRTRKLLNLLRWGPRGWAAFINSRLARLRGQRGAEEQDLDALDFIAERFGSSRSKDELVRMKQLYRINDEAAERYRMPRIKTHADLLMVKQDGSFDRVPDRDYWWTTIAPSRRLRRFDGDHATILKEPAVAPVAEALVRLMQAKDQGLAVPQ